MDYKIILGIGFACGFFSLILMIVGSFNQSYSHDLPCYDKTGDVINNVTCSGYSLPSIFYFGILGSFFSIGIILFSSLMELSQ